jgi:hypothetical protein
VRFNKEGNLLAVTTVDNGVKILANADGLRLLRSLSVRSVEAFRSHQYETSPIKVRYFIVLKSTQLHCEVIISLLTFDFFHP